MLAKLQPGISAFTRRELLAVIGVLCLLLVVLNAVINSKVRAQRINCAKNLQQLGLAFKTWALDRQDIFPMSLSTNQGGTKEYLEQGEVFRHFQVLSNELANPKVLICPADVRQPATNIGSGLSNSNLSYFIGLDATDTNPQMFLMGDRNLTNGPLPPNRILVFNTNYPASWTREMHRHQGNIGLADGSVQQFSRSRLNEALANSAQRLAMP